MRERPCKKCTPPKRFHGCHGHCDEEALWIKEKGKADAEKLKEKEFFDWTYQSISKRGKAGMR